MRYADWGIIMSVIMNVLNTARRERAGKKRAVPQDIPEVEKETIPIGQGFADKLNSLQESSVSTIEHPMFRKSTPGIANQQIKEPGFFSKITHLTSREALFGFFVFALLCASIAFFGSKIAALPTASPTTLPVAPFSKNIDRASISDTPIRSSFSKSLQGIVLDEGEDSYCILDGDLLKIGDVWRGSRITAISDEGVSLSQLNGAPILLTNRLIR